MKLTISPNQHLHIKQTLFHLAFFSFVVVIIWIGFEIYFSYSKRTESQQTLNLTQKIDPITPNLYTDLALELSERLEITDQELELFKPILHRLALQKQAEQEQSLLGSSVLTPVSTPPPATDSATTLSPSSEAAPN